MADVAGYQVTFKAWPFLQTLHVLQQLTPQCQVAHQYHNDWKHNYEIISLSNCNEVSEILDCVE